MGKLKRVLRCHNCGAILQTEDENLPGYITKGVIEGNSPRIPYCNKCYEKMVLLNTSQLDEDIDNAIIKILDDAVATDAFIIWVVDLFAFGGNINKEIAKKVKNLKVAVIGTKKDLFPSSIKEDTFIRFINERFNEVGITPTCVHIIGSENSIEFASLYDSLNKSRKGHDVYMIGKLSSGKTTIINKMLRTYQNKSKWTISSEIYPGTEVKVLEIPLSNSAFFYELPDLTLSTSAAGKVEKEILKQITPKKNIEISKKNLSVGDVLSFGSLCAFELIKGKTTAFKYYTSEGVETKKLSVASAREFFVRNISQHFLRPVSERFTLFSDFDVFDYTMENDGKIHDISVEGLCTVSFVAQGQVIRVTAPKGVALKECLAKVR